MLDLLRHHRRQVPNGLAIAAALLLVVSGLTGHDREAETTASVQETSTPVAIETTADNQTGRAAPQKRRGLTLSLLLFRR